MHAQDFDRITPFVRMMRVKSDLTGAGKWQDIDHVYTMIAAGSADFIVEGVRYSLRRGDIIVIPPFQTHVIIPTGGEELVQNIFHFDFFEDPDRCMLRHEDVLDSREAKVVPARERLMNDRAFATRPEPQHVRGRRVLRAASGILHRAAGQDAVRLDGMGAGEPARR